MERRGEEGRAPKPTGEKGRVLSSPPRRAGPALPAVLAQAGAGRRAVTPALGPGRTLLAHASGEPLQRRCLTPPLPWPQFAPSRVLVATRADDKARRLVAGHPEQLATSVGVRGDGASGEKVRGLGPTDPMHLTALPFGRHGTLRPSSHLPASLLLHL